MEPQKPVRRRCDTAGADLVVSAPAPTDVVRLGTGHSPMYDRGMMTTDLRKDKGMDVKTRRFIEERLLTTQELAGTAGGTRSHGAAVGFPPQGGLGAQGTHLPF